MLHFRPLYAADAREIAQLLRDERPAFREATWDQRELRLERLLTNGTLRGVAIADPLSGLRWAAYSGFLVPEASDYRLPGAQCLPDAMLHPGTLLSGACIAAGNAQRELQLVTVWTGPPATELAVRRMQIEALTSLHAGYGLKALWQQTSHPATAAALTELGMRPCLRVGGLPLYRYTADDAKASPLGRLASLFQYPPPIFSFTPRQQELLALAVLDVPDREAERRLGLTRDTIKKRWQSVYARVRQTYAVAVPSGLSGVEQRRWLLGYLRQHPEELR